MIRRPLGRVARFGAPRSIAALEDVQRLRAELDALAGRVQQLDQQRDAAARENGELWGRVHQLEHELAESRRLSLRVGQLSDLVFGRLAQSRVGEASPTSGAPAPREAADDRPSGTATAGGDRPARRRATAHATAGRV